MIQQKLSLPLACPILALIGLALGATNRKDGKLGSFVIGIGVIFVYYVLLWGARATAMGGRFSPEWAPWIAEHRHGPRRPGHGGVAGARRRPADSLQPARRLARDGRPKPSSGDACSARAGRRPRRRASAMPQLNLPMPRLLDVYVSREYLRVLSHRHRSGCWAVLHLDVHRSRRQAVSRRDHRR